jgi:hypothetical protein
MSPTFLRSALFSDRGWEPPAAEPWQLDPRRMPAHPLDFGASADAGAPARHDLRHQRFEWVSQPVHAEPPVPGRVHQSTDDGDAVSHSAARVAHAIVVATSSPTDVRTLNAWGQRVGVSRGALRVWCQAAGVSARSCLDFMRVLRAVLVADAGRWDLLSILDVVDKRTLTQLLERGNVRDLCGAWRPSVHEFLKRQEYIRDRRLVDAVALKLAGATRSSAEL